MGLGGADDPTGTTWRAAAGCQHARGHQRPSLPAVDRLPVAGAAQGFAAEEHGAPLFQAVGLGRHAGAHPLCALCGGARASGPRGKPERGHHRQSKRQDGAKKGASMDPQGYDAGKKVTGRKRHILVDTLGLLLSVAVHPADIQDRDGVAFVLNATPAPYFLSSSVFSQMEAIRARVPPRLPPPPANGSLKSPNATSCISSWCYPNGGSSNEPLPGSAAIAASRAISSAMRPPSPLSFASR